MGTQECATTLLESLSILDRVIPLAAGGPAGSLRIKAGRLIVETAANALALGFWPTPGAYRRATDNTWLPTERWADEFLSAWPRLEPGSFPSRDPFRSLRHGRRPAQGLAQATAQATEEPACNLWPFSAYLERIPAECRMAASRFSSRRWHLLRLFASDERFVELAASNPGLAFALASTWRFRERATSGTIPLLPAGLSGWKRRTIAAWLGFPATEAAVRTLGIIDPKALSIPLLLRLRDRMNAGSLDGTLSRLEHINAAMLRILVQPHLDAVAGPNLLRQIGTNHAGMLEQLRSLARALGEKEPDTPIHSIRRLESMYRERSERLQNRIWTKKSVSPLRDFGAPPFPAKPGIEPILNEAGLYVEGLEMRNCVPSCAAEVLHGIKYFYRVDVPVRATLLVERVDNDARAPWAAGDIRGLENKMLSPLVAEQCFRALLSTGQTDESSSEHIKQPCYRQAELPWYAEPHEPDQSTS